MPEKEKVLDYEKIITGVMERKLHQGLFKKRIYGMASGL
jgi:hypothetical protein